MSEHRKHAGDRRGNGNRRPWGVRKFAALGVAATLVAGGATWAAESWSNSAKPTARPLAHMPPQPSQSPEATTKPRSLLAAQDLAKVCKIAPPVEYAATLGEAYTADAKNPAISTLQEFVPCVKAEWNSLNDRQRSYNSKSLLMLLAVPTKNGGEVVADIGFNISDINGGPDFDGGIRNVEVIDFPHGEVQNPNGIIKISPNGVNVVRDVTYADEDANGYNITNGQMFTFDYHNHMVNTVDPLSEVAQTASAYEVAAGALLSAQPNQPRPAYALPHPQ